VSPQASLVSATGDVDDTGRIAGFLPAVAESLGSYVYLLIDPRDDRIFHVGTASGDGCFHHLNDARTDDDDDTAATVREIERAGHRIRIDILRHDLDPTTAATVAAAVVDVLTQTVPQGRSAADRTPRARRMSVGQLNHLYGATPVEILAEHPVVLIRIPPAFRRGTDRQLYEATRGWWKAGARRERAEWAFAVNEGVVRAVYRITGWEPARAGNRWGFRGHRDPGMEQRYIQRDVSAYLGRASMPLRYVNC
jgi:hypothetical protein